MGILGAYRFIEMELDTKDVNVDIFENCRLVQIWKAVA